MGVISFKVITLVELLASSIMGKDEKQGLDIVNLRVSYEKTGG